jgi:sugar phosphate isomerase/epimerase
MAIDGVRFGVFASALGSDPRQIARTAREVGFTGIQFNVKSGSLDLLELSDSGRREFRRIISSQDREVVGLRSETGPAGLGPGADVDREIARLDGVMEAAAGLGSPLACVDLGPLPPAPTISQPRPAVTPLEAGLILLPERLTAPPPPPPPAAPPPDPAFVSQLNSALAELGRLADRYSVVLAFRSELASFASLELALRQVNCPWFGVDFDPVGLLRDEWDVDEFFSRIGPLIRHVRARDAVGGQARRTKPAVVGQGSVPWEAILAALDEGGYQGWITIDSGDLPDRAAAAAAGLKYLQSLAIA